MSEDPRDPPAPPRRGVAVRAIIRESGLTQAWWAERLGVSEGTVSNWVAGNHEPREGVGVDALRAAMELDLSPEAVGALREALSARSQLLAASRSPGDEPMDGPHRFSGLAALGRRLDLAREAGEEEYQILIQALIHQVDLYRSGSAAARAVNELVEAWGQVRSPTISGQLLADLMELAERAKLAAAGGELDVRVHRGPSYVTTFFSDVTRRLERGDRYHTVSNLDFWSRHNLPGRRDFLEAQDNAARISGIDIRRLFVVPDDRDLTPDERNQLEVHLDAAGIDARALRVPSEEIPEIGNYVLTGPPEGFTSLYTLRFRTLPDSSVRELDRVTLGTSPREIARKAYSFAALFEKGEDLRAFVAEVAGGPREAPASRERPPPVPQAPAGGP